MNISALFQKKDKRAHFQKEANVYIRNPHASWILILKIFFLMLVVVLGLSAYKFYVTDKYTVDVEVKNESDTKEAIQVDKLDAILNAFDKKSQKTEEIKKTQLLFVDPSR